MGNIMEQVRIRRAVKLMRSRGFLRCAGIAALFSTSGCALLNQEGSEVYATFGTRAVHKYELKTETIHSPCRGWKYWVGGCPTTPQPVPTKEEGFGS